MTSQTKTAGRFPCESVSDALERSLRNAKHLRAKDSAAIAAARALAWRIDHWDELAERALEEVSGSGRRPSVPQNDNTSLPTFLKYCSSLGLVPEGEKPARPGRSKVKEPAPASVADEFEEYLSKVGG